MATTTTTIDGRTQTVVITRAPSVESSFAFERLNHLTKRLSGGNQFTLDMGPTLLTGELIFHRVKGDEARALMALLVDDVRFTLFEITITPPTVFDLGIDPGVPLVCRLSTVKSTKDIFTKANVTDRWDIRLPYEATIADGIAGLGVDGVA